MPFTLPEAREQYEQVDRLRRPPLFTEREWGECYIPRFLIKIS